MSYRRVKVAVSTNERSRPAVFYEIPEKLRVPRRNAGNWRQEQFRRLSDPCNEVNGEDTTSGAPRKSQNVAHHIIVVHVIHKACERVADIVSNALEDFVPGHRMVLRIITLTARSLLSSLHHHSPRCVAPLHVIRR